MAVRSRLAGVLLVVASVVALGLSAYSSIRSRSFAECQARVNEQLIVATNARAAAAEQDRLADRDETVATTNLINAVFTAPTVPERMAAYQLYRAELDRIAADRAAAEVDRAAHPLPAPPSQTCG